jgi:hypothetical protein
MPEGAVQKGSSRLSVGLGYVEAILKQREPIVLNQIVVAPELCEIIAAFVRGFPWRHQKRPWRGGQGLSPDGVVGSWGALHPAPNPSTRLSRECSCLELLL